jgi:hypothetical protein
MVVLDVMDDSVLVEGIMASIMFPLTKFFLKYSKGANLFWFLFFAWLFSWYMRKLSKAIFIHYKRKYGFKTTTLTTWIPFIQ